jgi:hypothetical protein
VSLLCWESVEREKRRDKRREERREKEKREGEERERSDRKEEGTSEAREEREKRVRQECVLTTASLSGAIEQEFAAIFDEELHPTGGGAGDTGAAGIPGRCELNVIVLMSVYHLPGVLYCAVYYNVRCITLCGVLYCFIAFPAISALTV